jgi:hypothetical protein
MVGIQMMGPHHNFGNHRRVVVWVSAGEIAWTAISHNHSAEVEDDCVCMLVVHFIDSCQVLPLGANWSVGP